MNSIESDSEDITKNTVMKSNKETSNDTLKLKSGIYKIVNKVDGKYYVGSTKDFDKRWKKKHRKQLRANNHYNDKLQRAWNKYGENSFEFQIIEHISPPTPESLQNAEQPYLDIAKAEQDNCYNLKFIAEGLYGMSDSAKEKFRKTRNCPEWKKKFSESCKRRPRRYGYKCSEEAKKKIGEKNKKRYSDPTKNPNYDKNVYEFFNEKTGESFTGTKYEFYNSFDSVTENIARYLVKEFLLGRVVISYKGWKIKSPSDSLASNIQ